MRVFILTKICKAEKKVERNDKDNITISFIFLRLEKAFNTQIP